MAFDAEKVRSNVQKMLAAGAPAADVDLYLQSIGAPTAAQKNPEQPASQQQSTLPQNPYDEITTQAAQQNSLPNGLLTNLLHTESGFDPNASNPSGATGIAQIIPKYHPGVDPTDPNASIQYAGSLLRKYFNEFGSWEAALAAYNWGETNVRKKGWEAAPKETKNYIKKILGGLTQGTPEAIAATSPSQPKSGQFVRASIPKPPAGQISPGNINLNNRPVVKNQDGTISTVRSITITDDQGHGILLPTIGPNGESWTPQQAIENYRKTGQNLGIFKTESDANQYAQTLHEQQAQQYTTNTPQQIPAASIQAMPESASWAMPARDILASTVRPVVEAGSAMVGSAMAPTAATTAISGGTTTPLLAAVGLGALGFAAAKTALDWIDSKLFEYESGHTAEDPTIKQQILTGLNNYRQGLMWEMLGRGAGEVVGKVGRALTAKLKTPIEEIAESLHQRFTRAESTQRKSWQNLETILNKAPGSADIMADFRFQQQLKPLMEERSRLLASESTSDSQLTEIGSKIYREVTKYLNDTTSLMGRQLEDVRSRILAQMGGKLPYESIGARGQEALRVAEKATRMQASALYQKAGENFALGENLPTPALNKKAEELLSSRLKLPAQDSSFMKRLRWAASSSTSSDESRMTAMIREQYPNMSEENLAQVTSKLNDLAPPDPSQIKDWQTLVAFERELGDLIDTTDALKSRASGSDIAHISSLGRDYLQLRTALQSDMEQAALKSGPQAWNQYQIAKTFYRENISEIFRTKQIRALYKSDPEDVIDAAFVPNGVAQIKLLKRALIRVPSEESPALKEMTGRTVSEYQSALDGFTQKLLGVGTGEPFDPKLFKRNLRKYGEEMLVEAYGKEGYGALRRASETGMHILLAEPIGENYLRSLTKADVIDYSFIVDNIIGAAGKSPTAAPKLSANLTLLKNILSPQSFRELSDIYLERIFSTEPTTNLIDPTKLSRSLLENKRVLKLWYPKETYNRLMDLAEVGSRQLQAGSIARAKSSGETLATWTPAGIVLRAAISPTLTHRAMAGLVTFGPKLLAKLYLRENGIALLKQASTLPVTSAKATEIATKLLTIAYGTPGQGRVGGIQGSIPALKSERVRREWEGMQQQ